MSNNATSNNKATVNTENKEESIMSNNVTSNNATVNTENKEETAMSENRTNNNNAEATNMRNNETENKNMETEVMKETMKCEETTNTADALDMSLLNNPSELIPESECGLSEADINKEKNITVSELVEPFGDILSEIPEEERAETESFPAELMDAAEYGYFNPVWGMRGFITSTNHIFYAKRCIWENGINSIRYRQQYHDHSYSPEIEINQADLYIASACNYMPEKASTAERRKKISKFIDSAGTDYLNKTLYLSEALDIKSVFKILVKSYDRMPVEDRTPLLEKPEKLYPAVIKVIKDKQLDIVDEHNAYYTLNKDQIEVLAHELDVKRNKLLEKLGQYRFLYLTSSSKGYQTCVRFKPSGEFFTNSYTEWCYCVLKMEYLAMQRKIKSEK